MRFSLLTASVCECEKKERGKQGLGSKLARPIGSIHGAQERGHKPKQGWHTKRSGVSPSKWYNIIRNKIWLFAPTNMVIGQ